MIREATADERETMGERLTAEMQREGFTGRKWGGPSDDQHVLIDPADPTVVIMVHPARADDTPASFGFQAGKFVWVPWLVARSTRVDTGELYLSLANYLLSKSYEWAMFDSAAVNGAKLVARLGRIAGTKTDGSIVAMDIAKARQKLAALGVTPG